MVAGLLPETGDDSVDPVKCCRDASLIAWITDDNDYSLIRFDRLRLTSTRHNAMSPRERFPHDLPSRTSGRTQEQDVHKRVLRLSVTHPEGWEKAMAVFTRQVKPALAKVIRSRQPARSAAFIATQLVGVAFLRYVLRLPDVVVLTQQDLEQVGQAIQRSIDGEDAATRSGRKTSRPA